MRNLTSPRALVLCFGLAFAGCDSSPPSAGDAATAQSDSAPAESSKAPATSPVGDARLAAAASDAANWLSHGRTYSEQRYSPLGDISEETVSDLGLAWSFDLGSKRGVQSTPIVADGVMYVTAPWSIVHALDAASGAHLWTYDPQVPRTHARYACCSVASRGVALYEGRVFVGTIDGRLVAIDAKSGELSWETLTVDPAQPYSITGAPRVVGGRVIIGNGGADLGVRGYVGAYAADTGEALWRTYTVPGDPSKPFESEALERAAATWNGEWWKYGGGGTVWDAIAYDAELDLLYIGTGNGSPHARWARSPGGGDNLYLASILALHPATGELVWHFQTTPADSWDYTATQQMVLADLEIDGRVRKVLMQAPKNGFFFVLDRETGEFISGEPFVRMNWAEGLDENGRPIESEYADYSEELRLIHPSAMGGHNWQPMAFHPGTGLMYIPALEIAMPMLFDKDWVFEPGHSNMAVDFGEVDLSKLDPPKSFLLAWDPVAQREVWRVHYAAHWNGGALATAGNLVFQGSGDGRLIAYRATDGAPLWESELGTAATAGPVSYAVDGVQYVAVAAGWGGSFAMGMGKLATLGRVKGGGRVLVFKLGGDAVVPAGESWPGPPPMPTFQVEATPEEVGEGAVLYHKRCGACHGSEVVGGGSVPDLRYASREVHERIQKIVRGGERVELGMPSFAAVLDEAQVRKIQAYILYAAYQAASEEVPESAD